MIRNGRGRVYLVAVVALSFFSAASAATHYKCVDPSGRVTFSDHPCDGGEEIELETSPRDVAEPPIDARLSKFRDYNEAVKLRLEIESHEREKNSLELRRRALIQERDAKIAGYVIRQKIGGDRYYWETMIHETKEEYEAKIGQLESKIFMHQSELQRLRSASDQARSQPQGRILGQMSEGKCRLLVEGEETAASVRVRAEGYQPGETIETISRSADETISRHEKVARDGSWEAILMPRVAGKREGRASFTVNGINCRLTVNFRWRIP